MFFCRVLTGCLPEDDILYHIKESLFFKCDHWNLDASPEPCSENTSGQDRSVQQSASLISRRFPQAWEFGTWHQLIDRSPRGGSLPLVSFVIHRVLCDQMYRFSLLAEGDDRSGIRLCTHEELEHSEERRKRKEEAKIAIISWTSPRCQSRVRIRRTEPSLQRRRLLEVCGSRGSCGGACCTRTGLSWQF